MDEDDPDRRTGRQRDLTKGNTFHNFLRLAWPLRSWNTWIRFRSRSVSDKMLDVFWDAKKRTPVMRELYEYSMSQVWFLALPSPWGYTVYQPWVHNFDGERSIGYWGQPWRFVWIDQDLKEQTLGRR